ncbi:MAG: 6-phosphogluconolactonase [Candidatus Glassbacteria bacterium]
MKIPYELSKAAAEEFVSLEQEAIKQKGSFAVALSGGNTPRGLYSLLASEADPYRTQIRWDRVHFFWGDERNVSPDHPDSNFRMVMDALLSKVPVPAENIHRIKAEDADIEKAAGDYERLLRKVFSLKASKLPRFDLVLLGMGRDGHTASLFPLTDVLGERERLVAALYVEKLDSHRITLTIPVINNAACIVFLVSGGEKAETLKKVLHGKYQPEQFPAQAIRPTRGRLLWIVDSNAARLLNKNT